MIRQHEVIALAGEQLAAQTILAGAADLMVRAAMAPSYHPEGPLMGGAAPEAVVQGSQTTSNGKPGGGTASGGGGTRPSYAV
jgi:hypothetical protein